MKDLTFDELKKIFDADYGATRDRLEFYFNRSCFPWYCKNSTNPRLLLVDIGQDALRTHLWCSNCLPKGIQVIRELTEKEIFVLKLFM